MKTPVFKERVVSALIFAPLVASSVYFGGYYFFALIALVTLAGTVEYRNALLKREIHVGKMLVPLSFIVAASGLRGTNFLLATLISGILLIIVASLASGATSGVYGAFGLLYIGGLFGCFSVLRISPGGREWALLVLFVTWATDVGAYLGGVTFGKHKMAPHISPNKSWEGAASGMIAAGLTALAVSHYTGLSSIHSIGLGVILGGLAETGDLAESLFKRFCGIKDSGDFMPGHGGVLDRFDSLLFTGAGGFFLYMLSILLGK